jgi:hypothetical protein
MWLSTACQQRRPRRPTLMQLMNSLTGTVQNLGGVRGNSTFPGSAFCVHFAGAAGFLGVALCAILTIRVSRTALTCRDYPGYKHDALNCSP